MPRSFSTESGRVETFDSNILFLLVYFRCITVEKMNKWFPLRVIMLIKGYVVPLRAQGLGSTSECAIKSLDNSSFKMDLYISGMS